MLHTGFFIILKKVKYSEADLILTALSSLGEKKSFLARNALKSKKRFGGGVLEPTHYVKLTYLSKEDRHQLNILEEAQLVNDFSFLRKNYDLLEFALQAVDCIYKVCQEGDQNSATLYNLVGHALKNLCKENINLDLDLPILKLQFFIKLLTEQGVLDPEPWMSGYLQTKLSDHENLRTKILHDKNFVSQIENKIKHYLLHANLD